ncbi:MAG: cysteine desulfurase [Ruminococcus sp.]|jgi:cysteine desulfurase|nr:cysteine desulfurase [Ruminococcus sp.]
MAIYLDNASTAKPCKEAIESALRCMESVYGNPSSLHKPGLEAEEEINAARKAVSKALSVNPETVFFTSCATEANNTLVIGAWNKFHKRKRRVVISSVEHPSIEEPIKYIESLGAEVIRINPENNGQTFTEAIDDNTFLCSVMSVNNETGTNFPIKEIFANVKRKNPECITHTDAVQAFMKIPLKPLDIGADSVTISAHKIHGIKGAGALYIKKGLTIPPLLRGGGQERGFRSGTEAVPAIAAFGAAVKAHILDIDRMYEAAAAKMSGLRVRLSSLPFITINSPPDSSPFILNFSVDGVPSEVMLHFLESVGIYVSSGSACSKGKGSHVLKAFGITDKDADEAIRVSISNETTDEELEILTDSIIYGFNRLQRKR